MSHCLQTEIVKGSGARSFGKVVTVWVFRNLELVACRSGPEAVKGLKNAHAVYLIVQDFCAS